MLLRLLSRLRAPSGQAIGAGQADGDGRVRLCPDSLTIVKTVLGGQGSWERKATAAKLPPDAGPVTKPRRWALRLQCDGPFAVLDPFWTQQHKTRDGTAALAAQKITETTPILPGTSVAGALRARAAWLAARTARRAGAEPRRDDPLAIYRPGDRFNLTPVQRLFGVTGFRGLLEIEDLDMLRPATPYEVFSVKLDRFSGGPMSGGLFETAAFLNVEVRLVLRLRERGTGIPTADDVALAEQLIGDICTNGLTLGHGGNKGFGWFTVKKDPTYAV